MKKIFMYLILGVLLLNTALTASAKDYSDLPKNHWANRQIKILTDEYVVVGYPDATFKADHPTTRAEFANMVIKALGQENAPLTETFEFKDVTYSHWAYNTIQRAIGFDLIKNTSDGLFRPEDNITKAEAVSIIIAAINTGDLSENAAKAALKIYEDSDKIPAWAVVPAGKSEIIGLTAHPPESKNRFEGDKWITRAEMTVLLYNMREEAKHNPNAKLAEAMRAKKGEGYVLKGVKVDGNIATIPKGAKIPLVLLNNMSSQTNEQGEVFLAKADKNIVSEEKFLLIVQGSNVNGEVTAVKHARLILRNGKLVLETKNINTSRSQTAAFVGKIDTSKRHNLLVKIVRFIIKGDKINLKEGNVVYVKLKKPLKVDITNGWIVE